MDLENSKLPFSMKIAFFQTIFEAPADKNIVNSTKNLNIFSAKNYQILF
jgi:hypothetical protein